MLHRGSEPADETLTIFGLTKTLSKSDSLVELYLCYLSMLHEIYNNINILL